MHKRVSKAGKRNHPGTTDRLRGIPCGNACQLFFLLALFASACVPNKKIVYLQHNEELKKDFPTDSVLRTYSLKKEPYLLKPEDIISLRVASITSQEYNFISQYEMQLGSVRKLSQYSSGTPTTGEGVRGGDGLDRMNLGNLNNLGGGAGSSLLLERLNGGFKIDSKGELELPQIGNIELAGLTITEAEEKIREALDGFYETPMVRVQLLNFHFTILGEVTREGRYTSYDPEPNIFDALILAGNLTELADRANIKIIRNNGDRSEIIYLNTLDENLLTADNFYLKPNDMIIVPPLRARSAQRYTLPRINTALGIISSSISLVALIITLSNR